MHQTFENMIQHCKCAVIVAHPDDETLWAGGTILMNPDNEWKIVTTCRKNDPDRSPKFYAVLKTLNAMGQMADLDDGPEQLPLESQQVQQTILSLLKGQDYDLIMTHSTQGEYTRHRRHEEVAEAVVDLIQSQQLKTKKLWMFAYTDDNHTQFPQPITQTDIIIPLPADIWNKKYEIITGAYGFSKDSWEAKTTPREEAFWSFRSAEGIKSQLKERSHVS